MVKPKIEEVPAGGLNHRIIRGDGFYISYVMAFSGPTGDETALVDGNYNQNDGLTNTYYILNGDWLKEYQELVPKGYKECKKFFNAHKKEYLNFWSN